MGEQAVYRVRRRSSRWHDVPTWVAVALLIVGAALLAGRFDALHPEAQQVGETTGGVGITEHVYALAELAGSRRRGEPFGPGARPR